MSKFSIFTLFISATIVVIVAELLTNEYVRYPEIRGSASASVLTEAGAKKGSPLGAGAESGTAGAATAAGATDTAAASDNKPASGTTPVQTEGGIAASPQHEAANATEDADAQAPKAKITFELINNAGFTGVSLQVAPFSGILFETVDLRGFKSVPVILNNLLINNRKKIASFYEFKAGTAPLSDEIFRMLKEKCGSLIGASINDTGAFGSASFYVNYVDRPKDAFLVVKDKDNVYALTYQKDYHELIRKLLWEITNN
jgi:hypothetical protein